MMLDVWNQSLLLPGWVATLLGFGTAFMVTYIAIPPIVDVARLKGLYDLPNGRTSHTDKVPILGGLAIFAGLILASIFFTGISAERELKYIIAGLLIMFFTGIKDDILVIDPLKKLLGQILAAGIIAILGGIRITNFHGFLGINDLPFLVSILFTIFVFTVIINGFNLIDGIDGLAAGVGVISSLTFGTWFLLVGYESYATMSFALTGALLAFIRFNVFSKKNKIFLGDTGSMIIGMVISVFAIRFLEFELNATGNHTVHSAPVVAFCILLVPLFDTLRVFTLRLLQGRSPFVADRLHVHHLLIDLGCTHLQATLLILIANMLFILLAFALQYLGDIRLMILILTLAGILSFIPVMLLRKKEQNSGKIKYFRSVL